MLLIFMSEHMFRSRDQSVKIQREFSRYTSMALCFFYLHSVPIPQSIAKKLQVPSCNTRLLSYNWVYIRTDVIYQTGETMFHRDIQTPRRELKIRLHCSGVFLTKFEVFG